MQISHMIFSFYSISSYSISPPSSSSLHSPHLTFSHTLLPFPPLSSVCLGGKNESALIFRAACREASTRTYTMAGFAAGYGSALRRGNLLLLHVVRFEATWIRVRTSAWYTKQALGSSKYRRLTNFLYWLMSHPSTRTLPLGDGILYFCFSSFLILLFSIISHYYEYTVVLEGMCSIVASTTGYKWCKMLTGGCWRNMSHSTQSTACVCIENDPSDNSYNSVRLRNGCATILWLFTYVWKAEWEMRARVRGLGARMTLYGEI